MEALAATQLLLSILTTLGIIYIGYQQLRIQKRTADLDREFKEFQRTVLERTDERDAYVNLLDGILDLKSWAERQPFLMRAIANHESVKPLVRNGVVKDEFELMARCQFFYQAEKLYHLSNKSGVGASKRRGLNREIEMWLSLEGMREFFNEFCEKAECFTDKFLIAARKYYQGDGFGV